MPSGCRARRLYCWVWSKAARVASSSGRRVVNFQPLTADRMTTPFSSATSTGASTVVHDFSSCSRLTLMTATPSVPLSPVSAEAR
jgi:hypothetical protein